eukprot:CAMPEP_0179315572 /NCGR_PEP_ID=MMETSP0797-20121207/55145_1 /TAXON_ID=47934 /ORGANISM="Dinophysis acuminata, Strain DAEP01" /LENGTH=78 /DNA_ID=CAMNT_0021026129 /DNA_START=17 /DNA_END=250 /DNA_ORIENTATION=-
MTILTFQCFTCTANVPWVKVRSFIHQFALNALNIGSGHDMVRHSIGQMVEGTVGYRRELQITRAKCSSQCFGRLGAKK